MSSLPLAWSEVLDNVLASLARAEAEATQAEEALAAGAPTERCATPVALDRLEERFRQLQSGLARAEQVALESEAACRQTEEAFQGWLTEVGAAGRKLATDPPRSV